MKKITKILAISMATAAMIGTSIPSLAEENPGTQKESEYTDERVELSDEEVFSDAEEAEEDSASDDSIITDDSIPDDNISDDSSSDDSSSDDSSSDDSILEGEEESDDSQQLQDYVIDISGQYADAHINADGESGYIIIKDTSIWKNGNELTEIGGNPLSSIICNGKGGYVSSISYLFDDGWLYDYTMTIKGKAGSDTGDELCLYITDATNDTYFLQIFSSSFKEHTVWYNSKKPDIIKIEWKNSKYDKGSNIPPI